MEKHIFLSYPLSQETPLYGNTPPLKIVPDRSIKAGDSCNTSIITFHNHSGTHIDAPNHFNDNGRKIAEYAINELIFTSPQIIKIQKKPGELITKEDITHNSKMLSTCDILLLKTSFNKYRNDEIYRLKNPGISPEAANYIRSNFENIKCIGIDSISISSYAHRNLGRKAHQIFFSSKEFNGKPVLLIEDMNLSTKHLDKIKRIIVCPIMVENVDSTPCTVVGII